MVLPSPPVGRPSATAPPYTKTLVSGGRTLLGLTHFDSLLPTASGGAPLPSALHPTSSPPVETPENQLCRASR